MSVAACLIIAAVLLACMLVDQFRYARDRARKYPDGVTHYQVKGP